jgi:hypothetical protein
MFTTQKGSGEVLFNQHSPVLYGLAERAVCILKRVTTAHSSTLNISLCQSRPSPGFITPGPDRLPPVEFMAGLHTAVRSYTAEGEAVAEEFGRADEGRGGRVVAGGGMRMVRRARASGEQAVRPVPGYRVEGPKNTTGAPGRRRAGPGRGPALERAHQHRSLCVARRRGGGQSREGGCSAGARCSPRRRG